MKNNKHWSIMLLVLLGISILSNIILFINNRNLTNDNKKLNENIEELKLENTKLNENLVDIRNSYDTILSEFETRDKSLVGYWVCGKHVIQIKEDHTFIWVQFSDKVKDKYIVQYTTGTVDDNTLLFDKVYKTDFYTLYYKPEQIPDEVFKNSTFSYVMNIMTNNVFVLSIGSEMTKYSFTRQNNYEIRYSDSSEIETIACPEISPNSVSGAFSGEAEGMGGTRNPVKVTITLDTGKITDVQVEGAGETPGIGSVAIEELPAKMISGNTIQVDAISGATITSNAIKEASKKALESAGLIVE